MRWTPGGRSSDIEDDRDSSGGGGGFGGIHIGIGGFLILLVLSLVFHRNFLALAGFGGGSCCPPKTASRIRLSIKAKNRWCNSSRSSLTTRSRPGPRF